MRKKDTRINHYNPCFWTAYWNPEYYAYKTANGPCPGRARDQITYSLNLLADKIIQVPFHKVHFHKDLGIAEISPESMMDFYKRRFPDEYVDFCSYVKKHPEPLYLDFEETLVGIEERGGYDSLMTTIENEGVVSVEHKGFLSCLLIIQAMRSYEMMTSMVDFAAIMGMAKWEYFWLLQNAWGNPFVLARGVTPLARSRWTFYRTREHRFPICDSPMMFYPNSIMAVLSPRLLLEIDLSVSREEDDWELKDGISFSKYREFRRRALKNSFKEILFHDPQELEQWRKLPEYKERCVVRHDTALAKTDIIDAANRVIFGLSGFDRISAEDERQMKSYFRI